MSKRERLRARDGDACWLCCYPMDFEAEPNSKRAPTREHLHAQALGGSDEIENLVLCHNSCNRHLASKPLEQKLKIRAKWHAEYQRRQARHATAAQDQATQQARTTALPFRLDAPKAPIRSKNEPPWAVVALVALGCAMFFAGLSAGLLVGT